MDITIKTAQPSWAVIGCSVRGVSHIAANTPNQDALVMGVANTPTKLPAVLVVSDGHGSPKYIRSHLGAQLAVHTARYLLGQWTQESAKLEFSEVHQLAQTVLPKRLTQGWLEYVYKDMAKRPFSPAEQETLAYYGIEPDAGHVVYGATLLAVVITSQYMVCVQLGDGDMVTVDSTGIAERVFAVDETMIANETHSLSEPEAWRHSRVACRPLGDEMSLILVSTDGYSNSFTEDAGFLQVGPDMVSVIREKGVEYVQQHLPVWLQEASVQGSGDDVTVGMLSCVAQANHRASTVDQLTKELVGK